MKDWHQRALELASKGLKAKDIMLKLQEENGDEYSKDIQEVIQKLTAKLATKTSEKAKEVRQDLDNVYNKLD